MRDIDLAQGLLAKLCHDLSGVLGAVDNGIDFLKMDDDRTREKALDLLHLSASQSIARLQFYRKAYGLAKYVGEVNLQEVDSLCRAFLDEKIDFNLDETYFNDPHLFLCDNTGKIIMCLVEVAASCLIYSGAIRVEIEKVNGAKRVAVVASGKKIKSDQEKYDILIGKFGEDVLSAMNIHYYYIFKLAEDIKTKIKIIASTNQIEFILV